MNERLFDFYEKYRTWFFAAVLFLLIAGFYRDWLATVAMFGGIGVVYGTVARLGNDHPLRDVLAVGALLAWALLCWQVFAWIVQHESAKAETFCGKIIQSESKTAPRQMKTYYYLIENQQGKQKAFRGHDYWGEQNRAICVHYVPKEKSIFFNHDYILQMQVQ